MSNSPPSPSLQNTSNPAWMVWTGRAISALPVLMLLMSAMFKFAQPDGMAKGLEHIGWKEDQMFTLGLIEVACTLLYVIPKRPRSARSYSPDTSEAQLLHVRVGDAWYTTVILGVLVWLGLFLRDARLRAIIPLRR